MTQPIVSVTYAVSIRDMLTLALDVRERVEAVLQPHLARALGELRTQRRERILPLYGIQSGVRRAIYRAQAVAPVGARLRFYVAYARGLWDVAPSLTAIVLMWVQEGSYGRV